MDEIWDAEHLTTDDLRGTTRDVIGWIQLTVDVTRSRTTHGTPSSIFDVQSRTSSY